jgi:ACS family tartrate transporter-like MFS transporter
VFFIGYFLFEVPSNLIMERVGARLWIARIMLTWGAVSAAMMFVHTPFSFYSLRFLLGLAEAGFYPGVILYVTYWIPATSRAYAISRFLALTSILGLFGGPLGGLLLKLNGMLGLAGWQWLFLLEGIPSMLLAFAVLAFLPDKPSQAGWLAPEEKEWLSGRLAAEANNQHCVQHLTLKGGLSDPRILQMCLIFIISSTAGNAVGFFGPKLLQARSGGAWSNSYISLILTIPAIVGAIAMWVAATHSDRTGQRRMHVTIGYIIAGLAFLACVYAPTAWWVVAALAVNALGERIGAGSYWALTTNLLGAKAAAGGIALINSVGNLGGFFGPILMGFLMKITGGSYAAGLTTAGALMILSALLAMQLLKSHPTHAAE